MSLKFGLLGLLYDKPMTGYELMKFFNRSLRHFWNAQTSQIYRDLSKLEDGGYLTSEEEEQSGRPNKKIYTISKLGKNLFETMLIEFKDIQKISYRDPLCMKIFFYTNDLTDNLILFLQKYMNDNQKFLMDLDNTELVMDKYAAEDPLYMDRKKFWKMTVSLGIKQVQANIEWARESIEILEQERGDKNGN